MIVFVAIVLIGCFIYLLLKEKHERQSYWDRIHKYFSIHPSASLSHVLPLLDLETDRDFAELITKVWGLSVDEIRLLNVHIDKSLNSKGIELSDHIKLYEGLDKLLKAFLASRK